MEVKSVEPKRQRGLAHVKGDPCAAQDRLRGGEQDGVRDPVGGERDLGFPAQGIPRLAVLHHCAPGGDGLAGAGGEGQAIRLSFQQGQIGLAELDVPILGAGLSDLHPQRLGAFDGAGVQTEIGLGVAFCVGEPVSQASLEAGVEQPVDRRAGAGHGGPAVQFGTVELGKRLGVSGVIV